MTISGLSGDNLFRPVRASVSPKYGVPFVLRGNESPPPSDDQLVTDTIPPLVVDAPVTDWRPWCAEEATRILAEVMLRDLPVPEPDPERAARVEAWSAARMREISAPIEPVVFEDLVLDPELEQVGHAVWSQLQNPVPAPRQRPRAVKPIQTEEAS